MATGTDRGLTPGEKDRMQHAFGTTVDVDRIRITETSNDRPFTTGNTVHVSAKDLQPDGTVKSSTLVHEGTHVWDYQHNGAGYAIDSMVRQFEHGDLGLQKTWEKPLGFVGAAMGWATDQIGKGIGKVAGEDTSRTAYDYSKEVRDSTAFTKLNPEQKAQLEQDFFRRTVDGGAPRSGDPDLKAMAPDVAHISPMLVSEQWTKLGDGYKLPEPVTVTNEQNHSVTTIDRDGNVGQTTRDSYTFHSGTGGWTETTTKDGYQVHNSDGTTFSYTAATNTFTLTEPVKDAAGKPVTDAAGHDVTRTTSVDHAEIRDRNGTVTSSYGDGTTTTMQKDSTYTVRYPDPNHTVEITLPDRSMTVIKTPEPYRVPGGHGNQAIVTERIVETGPRDGPRTNTIERSVVLDRHDGGETRTVTSERITDAPGVNGDRTIKTERTIDTGHLDQTHSKVTETIKVQGGREPGTSTTTTDRVSIDGHRNGTETTTTEHTEDQANRDQTHTVKTDRTIDEGKKDGTHIVTTEKTTTTVEKDGSRVSVTEQVVKSGVGDNLKEVSNDHVTTTVKPDHSVETTHKDGSGYHQRPDGTGYAFNPDHKVQATGFGEKATTASTPPGTPQSTTSSTTQTTTSQQGGTPPAPPPPTAPPPPPPPTPPPPPPSIPGH